VCGDTLVERNEAPWNEEDTENVLIVSIEEGGHCREKIQCYRLAGGNGHSGPHKRSCVETTNAKKWPAE